MNNKNKVLIVTLMPLYINSSVTISNLSIIDGLLENGFIVDVLMPYHSENHQNYDKSIDLDSRVNVINFGSVDTKKSASGKNKKNKIKRLFNWLFEKMFIYDKRYYYIRYAKETAKNLKDYDVMISLSDPKSSHVFASKLIKSGLKVDVWIQHWGDPLTLDITKKHIYPKVITKRIEYRLLNKADYIYYVSPITTDKQKQIFKKIKEKISFIPLGYRRKKIYPDVDNVKLTFGYFGDYNSKIRDIMPIYNYFSKNVNYNLIIAGSTDLQLKETRNIRIYGRVSLDKVEELTSKCDVIINVCNIKGTQIPGKIFYYAGTNKELLILVDGENSNGIKEYFDRTNRYLIIYNKYESIDNALKEYKKTNREPYVDYSSTEIIKKITRNIKELK